MQQDMCKRSTALAASANLPLPLADIFDDTQRVGVPRAQFDALYAAVRQLVHPPAVVEKFPPSNPQSRARPKRRLKSTRHLQAAYTLWHSKGAECVLEGDMSCLGSASVKHEFHDMIKTCETRYSALVDDILQYVVSRYVCTTT